MGVLILVLVLLIQPRPQDCHLTAKPEYAPVTDATYGHTVDGVIVIAKCHF